jgi:phosphate transport system permease protein
MLRLVPNSYREASIALGATKSWTILRVVVPAATGSIITGVMLAIARVAGETAPLLFTVGLSTHMPVHLKDLKSAFPSLTAHVFNFATSPYTAQQRMAWAGILVLILLILFLNVVVRLTLQSRRKR